MAICPQGDFGCEFGSPFSLSSGGKGVADLVSLAMRGGLAIGGVIIIFFLLMGGIQIIKGAGEEKPESIQKGRQAITAALIGFVVIFTAFWIIRVIEIIAGTPFITAPGI